MGSRRAGVLLTALALAAAGCGDDDEDTAADAPATVESRTPVEQDADAKADARNLVVLVEVCFVETQDYTRCVGAAGQEDVGEATVNAPSATEFAVTAPSESGNEFTVTKLPGGSLERTCEVPGEGACADDGSW